MRLDNLRGVAPVEKRERQKIEGLTFSTAAEKFHEEQKATRKNGKRQDQWINPLKIFSIFGCFRASAFDAMQNGFLPLGGARRLRRSP